MIDNDQLELFITVCFRIRLDARALVLVQDVSRYGRCGHCWGVGRAEENEKRHAPRLTTRTTNIRKLSRSKYNTRIQSSRMSENGEVFTEFLTLLRLLTKK